MNRLLFFSLLFTSISQAQWSTDPANNLIVGYGQDQQLCSDGAGGCYITYTPELVAPYTIRVVRLNRFGYNAWGGYRIIAGSDSLPSAWFAKIIGDGHGGVIVAYDEAYIQLPTVISRAKLQRLDSSGNFLWGPTGVRVTLAETDQGGGEIVPDGGGGCIAVMGDSLGLRINRISAAGTRAWGDSGKSVGISSSDPIMVDDGENGCVVGVHGATTTLFRRLSSDGTTIWSSVLTDFPTTKATSDGFGGVITAGMKFISYNNGDPYWRMLCQRIDSSGSIRWGGSGVMLEDSIQNVVLNPPSIALEKNIDGGATFAWGKRVRIGVIRTYVQRVRPGGAFAFPDTGIQVSAIDSGGVGTWGIVSSLEDSKIFVNADARNNGTISAQRMDSTGSRLWNINDAVISRMQMGDVKSITDGKGGVIILGYVQSDFSIRSQQVSLLGNLGEVITSVDSDFIVGNPDEFTLYQNYPNPFNGTTSIRFTVPQRGSVRLTLYNVLGQRLGTLLDGLQEAGAHTFFFDAGNLASGMYIYKLETQFGSAARRLLIIK